MESNYKYKSLSDFRKANLSEYHQLHYKGLIQQLCDDMGWKQQKRNYWTYEKCKEVASKFTSVKDWRENCIDSHNASRRKGWFDELSAGMVRLRTITDWTLEICKEVALKYKTKSLWFKENAQCVRIAKENGWYEECVAHMDVTFIPSTYWTKERCIEETKKFKTKKEWKHDSSGSYRVAIKNKWVDELSAHMKEYLKPAGYWTLELCLEQALNFDMKERWKKGHAPSYQAARVYGWVDECSAHMIEGCKPSGYWNKKRCIEDAKNYSTFKEWAKKGSGSIQAARINGWVDECSVHIIRTSKRQGYWNIKENCLEEAKKYTRLCDWSKASSGSYTGARKNGWFEECTAHMTIIRTRKKSK